LGINLAERPAQNKTLGDAFWKNVRKSKKNAKKLKKVKKSC